MGAVQNHRRREQIEEARNRGIGVRGTPSGEDIPVCYGQTGVNSLLAYPGLVGRNVPNVPLQQIGQFGAPNGGGYFGGWHGNVPRGAGFGGGRGGRNTILMNQHVVCVGDVETITDILLEDYYMSQRILDQDFWGIAGFEWRNGNANTYSRLAEAFWRDNGGSTELVRGSTDIFDGLTYLTAFYRHDRSDPLLNPGSPNRVFVFLRGRKIRSFEPVGNTFRLSAERTYSESVPRILADYLTDTRFGPQNITADDLDMDSFAAADAVASQEVLGSSATALAYLHQNIPAGIAEILGSDRFRESFSSFYQREYGFPPDLTPASIGAGAYERRRYAPVHRFEFNGRVDTSRDYPSQIARILDAMPGALFWRSLSGKYKIAVGDPTRTAAAQSVGNLDGDNLISVLKYDHDARYNSALVDYEDIELDLQRNKFTWPTPGGALARRWEAEDRGRKLPVSLQLNGTNNRHHATSTAYHIIALSRRPRFRLNGFLSLLQYEPGDVLRLTDTRQDIDTYIFVQNVNTDGPTQTVNIEAVEFFPEDWEFIASEFYVLRADVQRAPGILPPTNVTISQDPSSHELVVAWINPDEQTPDVTLIDMQFTGNGGLTWITQTQISAEADVYAFVPFGIQLNDVRVRLRAVTATGRASAWAVSNSIQATNLEGAEPVAPTGTQRGGWNLGRNYRDGDTIIVRPPGQRFGYTQYECQVNHTSTAETEPGVGSKWMTVWEVGDECDAESEANGEC